jgi:hypothetical protein
MPQQPVSGALVDWQAGLLLVVGSLFVGGLAAVVAGRLAGWDAALVGILGTILAFVVLTALLFGR